MKFKVGDLIYDKDFPEDGMALVIEVRKVDRRYKHWRDNNGYRCLETLTGKTNWYTVGYIEEECEWAKTDTKCPGLNDSKG